MVSFVKIQEGEEKLSQQKCDDVQHGFRKKKKKLNKKKVTFWHLNGKKKKYRLPISCEILKKRLIIHDQVSFCCQEIQNKETLFVREEILFTKNTQWSLSSTSGSTDRGCREAIIQLFTWTALQFKASVRIFILKSSKPQWIPAFSKEAPLVSVFDMLGYTCV